MIDLFLRHLPFGLGNRIEQRPGLVKILDNIGWLFFDKFLRMAVGLVAGVWVARYLGPGQYGLLSFTIALVGLFGGISSLGLNGIVVRDIVKEPESADVTLGTAFQLQIYSGLLAFGLAVLTISILRPDDPLVRFMVAILGFTMVFKATDVLKYWFESQVQSKYVVWVENSVYFFVLAIKIGLILIKAPLIAFAWAVFAESLLIAIGLFIAYSWSGGHLKGWRREYQRAVRLLKDAWPLLLSGSFVLINMNIDRVLLGNLTDEKEVGFYSVAFILISAWYFVPVAIGGSVSPMLTKLFLMDQTRYEEYAVKLYRYFNCASFVFAVTVFFLADPLINFLYGNTYSKAGGVLAVGVWSTIFVSQVSIRGRMLIIEGAQTYVAVLVFLGMITNIFLNLFLAPSYGAMGTAYAYAFSWGLSAIFFPLLFHATRHHVLMIIGLRSSGNINSSRII